MQHAHDIQRRAWYSGTNHRGTTWESLRTDHPEHPTPIGIETACPTCAAEPGYMCVTASGLLLDGWASHATRGRS